MDEQPNTPVGPDKPTEPAGPSFDQLINDRAKNEQERVRQEIEAAANTLKTMLTVDTELQHTAYMMLLGYRLIQWAAAKVSEYDGMTNLMLRILVNAQEEKSRSTAISFIDLVRDLDEHQMPWLMSQKNEALARDSARKHRLRDLDVRIRRKDIPLPFHSMCAACGEAGFTHEKSIILVGKLEAIRPILRFCSLEYQHAGGLAALLSTVATDKDDRIAKIVLPPNSWRNCAEIYGNLVSALSLVARGLPNKSTGLLLVDSLDDLLMVTSPPMDRDHRVMYAANLLLQYQAERGLALLMGLPTDQDPPGAAPLDIYPWLEAVPHVQVALEESKLVGGSQNIIVGNDVMPLYQIMERLKGTE
jgi:hypothetical protein